MLSFVCVPQNCMATQHLWLLAVLSSFGHDKNASNMQTYTYKNARPMQVDITPMQAIQTTSERQAEQFDK